MHPLAVLRRALGLSQVDLAALASVSETQLRRIELGYCRPYPRTAAAIAAALGSDVETLFPENESSPGPDRSPGSTKDGEDAAAHGPA